MRKLHKLLMAALVLVPLAACDEGDNSVVPDPAVGTVTGTVAVEGTGLAGVTVSLAGPSVQSTTTGAGAAVSTDEVTAGSALPSNIWPIIAGAVVTMSISIPAG